MIFSGVMMECDREICGLYLVQSEQMAGAVASGMAQLNPCPAWLGKNLTARIVLQPNVITYCYNWDSDRVTLIQ